MENQNQFQGKNLIKIIIGIAIILIILITIIAFYYPFEKTSESPFQPKTETPEAPKITLPKILYNLAGVIKNIGQNSFIFEATIPQIDENNQVTAKTEIRKVLIAPTTKFSRLTFVAKEGQNGKTPVETAITFRNLKVGDYVEVISNQDISQKEEFEATQIRILPH